MKKETFGETFDLELRKPVTLGDLVVDVIKLSEPIGSELVASGKAGTEMESLIVLIVQNGKVPAAVVNKIGQRDLQRAANFFAHFAEPGSSETSATEPQS